MQEVTEFAQEWKNYVGRHNRGQTTRAEDISMESRRNEMLQKGNSANEKKNELQTELTELKELSANSTTDAHRLQGFVNKLSQYMSLSRQ